MRGSDSKATASCVHVSALLHALVSLDSSSQSVLSLPETSTSSPDTSTVPVTSLPNSWKPPRKRKESTLMMSEAKFEKHIYARDFKHLSTELESFDPRPADLKGTATALLSQFLETTREEGLSTSLLFDESARVWEQPDDPPSAQQTLVYNFPTDEQLHYEINCFMQSLAMSEASILATERETRGQADSLKWFNHRRFRITASHFGEIYKRKVTTKPDALVLRLLAVKGCYSDAASMQWGRRNEQVALSKYKEEMMALGHGNMMISRSGLWVCSDHPYLGASPDASVFDTVLESHGFAEVKCPYKHRQITPQEAARVDPSFCCELVKFENGDERMQLKKNHIYYCQIQGQMAVGRRLWNDFIVYTTKGIHIERVSFDKHFWEKELLPKLKSFFENCLAPEILHPMHAIGLPLRDLRHCD